MRPVTSKISTEGHLFHQNLSQHPEFMWQVYLRDHRLTSNVLNVTKVGTRGTIVLDFETE